MVKNIYDVFSIVDKLYEYLENKSIEFDESGFPIFEEKMFLKEWPNAVVPYPHRKNKIIKDKSKTVICFFTKDHALYPRLERIDDDLSEFKEYLGVAGLDITVTEDMDEEWQRIIVLLNHLYLAVLATNGVKILLNTRTGGLDSKGIFNNIPKGIMCISGFLGCDALKDNYDYSYLNKIMALLPSKLIIYGKKDKIVENQLENMGVNYKYYDDFHKYYKGVKYGR